MRRAVNQIKNGRVPISYDDVVEVTINGVEQISMTAKFDGDVDFHLNIYGFIKDIEVANDKFLADCFKDTEIKLGNIIASPIAEKEPEP